jgi:hypothetical protein
VKLGSVRVEGSQAPLDSAGVRRLEFQRWHATALVNRIHYYATSRGETPSIGGPFASAFASVTAIRVEGETALEIFGAAKVP